MNLTQSHTRLKHDSAFVWRPRHVFIPAMNFTGMSVGAINEGGSGNFVYGQKWEGSHTGTPTTREISTFGVNAVLMNTASQEVNHYMLLPGDLDLSKRLYVRVHWTSASADAADTIDWKVWYKPIVTDVTAISAIGASGGTALDRVIPQDSIGTAAAYLWHATDYGYIDAGKLADNVESILWSVEMDAASAGHTEDKFLLGLELMYSPRYLVGPGGMMHEAKRSTHMLGKVYRD